MCMHDNQIMSIWLCRLLSVCVQFIQRAYVVLLSRNGTLWHIVLLLLQIKRGAIRHKVRSWVRVNCWSVSEFQTVRFQSIRFLGERDKRRKNKTKMSECAYLIQLTFQWATSHVLIFCLLLNRSFKEKQLKNYWFDPEIPFWMSSVFVSFWPYRRWTLAYFKFSVRFHASFRCKVLLLCHFFFSLFSKQFSPWILAM